MGLFYHGLGLILMYLGSTLATNTITNYQSPQFPVSVSLAISSGLLEESVFFGIPFYMTGNTLVLLSTGIVWSVAHLFNAGVFSTETLAYGGFLLSIPHIFFSIRTWISKKGWFAIIFHSGWNFSFLIFYCMLGMRECSILNDLYDFLNLVMAASAGIIVYLAYKNKQKQINRFLFLVPVAVIFIALAILFFDETVL